MSTDHTEENLPVTAAKTSESVLDSTGIDVAATLGLHDDDHTPLPNPDMGSMEVDEKVTENLQAQQAPGSSTVPSSSSRKCPRSSLVDSQDKIVAESSTARSSNIQESPSTCIGGTTQSSNSLESPSTCIGGTTQIKNSLESPSTCIGGSTAQSNNSQESLSTSLGETAQSSNCPSSSLGGAASQDSPPSSLGETAQSSNNQKSPPTSLGSNSQESPPPTSLETGPERPGVKPEVSGEVEGKGSPEEAPGTETIENSSRLLKDAQLLLDLHYSSVTSSSGATSSRASGGKVSISKASISKGTLASGGKVNIAKGTQTSGKKMNIAKGTLPLSRKVNIDKDNLASLASISSKVLTALSIAGALKPALKKSSTTSLGVRSSLTASVSSPKPFLKVSASNVSARSVSVQSAAARVGKGKSTIAQGTSTKAVPSATPKSLLPIAGKASTTTVASVNAKKTPSTTTPTSSTPASSAAAASSSSPPSSSAALASSTPASSAPASSSTALASSTVPASSTPASSSTTTTPASSTPASSTPASSSSTTPASSTPASSSIAPASSNPASSSTVPASSTPASSTTTTPTSLTSASSTSSDPATSSSVTEDLATTSSSTSANLTKMGMDIQLFQLLQANFPNLQLDAFRSIFQVNTLKQLQQQQQQQQKKFQQQQQQQQHKLQQQISNVKAALESSGVSVVTAPAASSGNSQADPDSAQTIKFGGKTVTNTTLKFTEDGIKGVEMEGGEINANLSASSSDGSSQGSSAGAGAGLAQVSLASLGQTITIGGRNVTNATLKLGEDGGLSGIDIGTSPLSSMIKIGGDSSGSGMSTNLIMGMGGPMKVATLFPSTSTTSSSLAGDISSSSVTLTSAASSTAKTSITKADDKSRPPVFARILANLKRQGGTTSTPSLSSVLPSKSDSHAATKATITLPGFTSPLVLSRQRDSSGTTPTILATIPGLPSSQLAPISGSLISPGAGGGAAAASASSANVPLSEGSKRSVAKRQRAQLSQILVDQEVVTEEMEVDVGKPLYMVELPVHLHDHTYSFYNPEEGEKMGALTGMSAALKSSRGASTIPPARVSYAPQVRDEGGRRGGGGGGGGGLE